VADAIFLVDNQRYVRKDFSLSNNLSAINALIVEQFYNMLCAGEETKSKHIGAKMLDAGDIIQSLAGWTVIGYGQSSVPRLRWFNFLSKNFLQKSTETHRGVQAMDEAISELSLKCNPADAGRALYLVSGPAKEMNMDLIKELADYLRGISPQAVIRNGDYPREKGFLDITTVLSEFNSLDRVRGYFEKATDVIHGIKGRRGEFEDKLREIDDMSKDLPSLL
jgi:hypothetical protein